MSADIKPGWYWARSVYSGQPMRWEVVEVVEGHQNGELIAYVTGWDSGCKLEGFEFGQRIEEPPP